MKIALVTCSEISDLVTSDKALRSYLLQNDNVAETVIWTDSFDPNAYDALILRSIWDYHLNYQAFITWISAVHTSKARLINPFEVVKWNIDKKYLIDLKNQNCPIVPTVIISQHEKNIIPLTLFEILGSESLIIKPTISASSFLTFKISANDPNILSVLQKIQEHSDVMIQPYISSIESDGELSLIYFNIKNAIYSHSVLKKPNQNEFRVQKEFGGSESFFEPAPHLKDFTERCLNLIPFPWVYARIDIINWSRSPMISEIELIEPNLFFDLSPNSSRLMVKALTHALENHDNL